MKIDTLVGVHDLIIHSKFGLNIFKGFRSTVGRNFRFPIDFAGHCYNSAAATTQPVITSFTIFLYQFSILFTIISRQFSYIWIWIIIANLLTDISAM